jgi:SAM-dependent methyltransferase
VEVAVKKVRKTYRDFWAEHLIIKAVQAVAGDVDLSEVYREEANFIKEVLGLTPGQRVLDMGCGTGGHCLALAEQGIDATGIDLAPVLTDSAREQARQAGLSATFVCADMRTFRPPTPFHAVFTSSGTYGLYASDADNRSVLRTIHAALADNGRFLIGPSGPSLLREESFSTKDWFLSEDGCFLRERAWDQATSLFRESWLFIDEGGSVSEFAGFDDSSDGQYSRIYAFEELRTMLTEEGLAFEAAYGSFELPPKPHGPDTPGLLIVGSKV